MSQPLDYAPPARARFRLLSAAANVSLVFPVLVAAAVYGEWMLAWASLGHAPHPRFEDPRWIVGLDWLHDAVGLGLLGSIPAGMLAFVLNVVHVQVNHPPRLNAAARILVVIVSWGVLFAVFGIDPGNTIHWYLD
jgi:hypothetical protein